MNVEQLKDRISKKELQLEKLNKKLQKLENKNNETGFIKEYAEWYSNKPKDIKTLDQLITARSNVMNEPLEHSTIWVNRALNDYLRETSADIARVQKEMSEVQQQIDKYNLSIDREIASSNITKIPVIEEFLNAYKTKVIDYVTSAGLESVKDYLKAASDYVTYFNNSFYDSDRKENLKKLKEIRDTAREYMDPLSFDFIKKEGGEVTIDLDRLNAFLDKDCDNKYNNMLSKVEKVVGTITNASGLRIGNDGNINGIIEGTLGSARLETIGAGGYNTERIVNVKHGQRYHFRLLVHKINK